MEGNFIQRLVVKLSNYQIIKIIKLSNYQMIIMMRMSRLWCMEIYLVARIIISIIIHDYYHYLDVSWEI